MNGIEDEVQEGLHELLPVTVETGEEPPALQLNLDAREPYLIGDQVDRLSQNLQKVKRFQLRTTFPCEVQEIGDDHLGSPHLVHHTPHHLLPFFIGEAVIILQEHMGGDGDIVERIIQFVGNTGGKRSDCPHLVRLNKNRLTALQLLDHLIDRDGQVGELVPETAPGSNRGTISRGDPFGVHGEPLDGAQYPGAKEVRIQNEKDQQEDKGVDVDMAGAQDGLGK